MCDSTHAMRMVASMARGSGYSFWRDRRGTRAKARAHLEVILIRPLDQVMLLLEPRLPRRFLREELGAVLRFLA